MVKARRELTKENFNGLTKDILITLAAGGFVVAMVLMPGLGYIIKEIEKEKYQQAKKRGALASTLKRLEKQKLVGWQEIRGERKLILTEKGKRRVLQYNLEDLQLKKPKKWDGLFRIVIFDIPKNKNKARDALRKKLKELEFHQLQESVFVTPFECKDEIDFLRHTFEISPHVNYILAKEISNIDIKIWFKREDLLL